MARDEYENFVRRFLHVSCRSLVGLDIGRLEDDLLSTAEFDLRKPFEAALRSWARLQGKRRWGEKTPGNLFYADVIYDMFPSARFVYLVRDPRAGVSSMQNVAFFPHDVVFNAMNRRKHSTEGRSCLEKHVPSSQRMTVRYEDLVSDPRTTIERICSFLDEDYEMGMLRFHEDAHRFMNEEAALSYNHSATHPILCDKKAAWRDDLSRKDVAFVENICREEMMVFGYQPDGIGLDLRQKVELIIKEVYWARMCKKHNHVRQYTVRQPMFARARRSVRQLIGLPIKWDRTSTAAPTDKLSFK